MVYVEIKKKFYDFELDVFWEIDNKVLVVFGPSGSGKSLTLKSIAGVVKPDSGRIIVKGNVLFDSNKNINLEPQKRRVGYLPQNHALFPHLSVYKNIFYGKDVDKRWVHRLIEITEIEHLMERFPKELSGGESQRVALIRSLATKPDVLLLDEPFSALHRVLKEKLFQEIRRLKEELNIPVIMVSHDMNEVFQIADEVVVYIQGRVRQKGDVYDVYFKPKDVEVAKLFGHNNFVRVKIVERGSGWTRVLLPTSQIIIVDESFDYDSSDALLLIPSSSLALKKEYDTVKMVLKVLNIRKLGEDVVIELGMDGATHLTFRLPEALTPNFILEPGRTTDFLFSSRLFHLLPFEEV